MKKRDPSFDPRLTHRNFHTHRFLYCHIVHHIELLTMIYKVTGIVALASPAAALFKTKAVFTGSGNGMVGQQGIRGPSFVAYGSAEAVDVFHPYTEMGVPPAAAIAADTILATPTAGATGYGVSVAVGGDHVTGPMLFTAQTTLPGINSANVVYYRGAFSTWSVQQMLSPPAEYFEQNFFGSSVDLDRNNRQLAVGCPGCNSSHINSGTIFFYEPSSPDAKKWVRTGSVSGAEDDLIAGYNVDVSNNVATSIVYSTIAGTNPRVAVFSKEGKDWKHAQTMRAQTPISDANVYDETIVFGSTSYNTDAGAVFVAYPSTERFHLKPAGKPRPVQWSVQQILEISGSTKMGAAVSIDGDRLVATNVADGEMYVYERKEVAGKWSLQQTISVAVTGNVMLRGSSVAFGVSADVHLFDETEKWDCLIVSVEDHFYDGWDKAELTVEVPGGDKDFFSPRCDLPNPFQFRYCPADKADAGLYKFSVPEAVKSKFYWEMVWRVYEEKSGNWFTGNWDTKMDFEWNSDKAEFTHKKMDRTLSNNITCKECRQKPKAKGQSLRQLHSKDSTVHPTISPAPTIATTDSSVAWQELALVTQGSDWFDAQHRGTSYYISDKGGHRLLSTGTMCPWEANPTTKTCWEEYPDGEYILRVGGALDRVTDHTFRYCKSKNDLGQQSQVIFRVSNGDCEIVSYATSAAICSNKVGIVQMASVTISILGVSGEIGASERAGIQSAVASVLSGISASDVSISSITSDGSSSSVTLTVRASSVSTGVNFADADQLDAFEANMLNTLQTNERGIWNALVSGETANTMHSATAVHFNSFHLTGGETESLSKEESVDMVVDTADASGENTKVHSSSSVDVMGLVSVAGYVLAAVGAVAMAAFFVVSRVNTPASNVDVAVPTVEMSSPNAPVSGKRTNLSGATLTAKDLHELVRTEEASLKVMLRNVPQV
jgi:hypothetical protein